MAEFLKEQAGEEFKEVYDASPETEEDYWFTSESNKRYNVAAAIRHYARQRAEQRRNGHIPRVGDGWKYK